MVKGTAADERLSRGFTSELMVVVSILGILAAIALPNYKQAIIQAKEAVLREDLYRFRDLIDQYYADKGELPGVAGGPGGGRVPAQASRSTP